jgi:hypothetical protein
MEDGGNEFAGYLPGFAADGAIAFSFPSVCMEGRSIAASTSQRDASGDRIPGVVIAHRHLAGGRETGFEFDAPLDQGGFGIGGFHVEEWMRVIEVHADFPLASSPWPRVSHLFDHHFNGHL